jgi:hypothetical protein
MSLKKAWAVAAVITALGASVANAQIRAANSKILDDYLPGGYTPASRSLYHARDYGYEYRAYVTQVSTNNQTVDAEIAKEHAQGLGHNIALLEKHLASMRKHAAGDKETLASLDTIEKHVKAASASQAKLAGVVAKSPVDIPASTKFNEEAVKELDEAITEHDALMKKVAAKKKPAAK